MVVGYDGVLPMTEKCRAYGIKPMLCCSCDVSIEQRAEIARQMFKKFVEQRPKASGYTLVYVDFSGWLNDWEGK